MKLSICSFLALTFLVGCAPAYDHSADYHAALNRQAMVPSVTVDNHPLTQEELARTEDLGRPKPLAEIVVTTGPLSQPYETLGEVHVSTVGEIYLGSLLQDSLFRSPLARSIQATPATNTATMNEKLKTQAREQYGGKADAIINVTYRVDPDGDVFASGLAVHFIEPQPTPALPSAPPTRSLEERLLELRNLREKGLIGAEEYYEKRMKLLEGL